MSVSLLLERPLYLTITIMTETFVTARLIYSDHSDLTFSNDQSRNDFITVNLI